MTSCRSDEQFVDLVYRNYPLKFVVPHNVSRWILSIHGLAVRNPQQYPWMTVQADFKMAACPTCGLRFMGDHAIEQLATHTFVRSH